jgi:hypothetical protein
MWLSLQFTPSSADFFTQAQSLYLPKTKVIQNEGSVSLLLQMEVAQLPDYKQNQYLTDLFVKAGIDTKLQFKVQTTASAVQLFGSEIPLIECLS